MEIIQKLTESLGISDDQAKGGTGLLLKLASEKLGDGFSGIQSAIPEASSLISDAPAEKSSGLMGAVGGLMSGLGGKAGAAGSLASLAAGFGQLGLDGDMVGKFTAVVVPFIREKAGDSVADKLSGVFG